MKRTSICLALWLTLVKIVQATTITFEPGPPPVGRIIPEWREAGFLFSTPNGLSHYSSGSVGNPDNGTPFVRFLAGQSPLTITPIGGDSFTAVSVDLAEYSTVFPTPAAISFVGTRSDSSVVSVRFVTDGVIDGPGGVADFQTFFFPSTFTDLAFLRVDTTIYAMDNFTVAVPVPEPGVCALFAVGVAGVILFTRRKARRKLV